MARTPLGTGLLLLLAAYCALPVPASTSLHPWDEDRSSRRSTRTGR